MTTEEKLMEIARLLTYASGAKSYLTMQTPESILEAIREIIKK